MKYIQWNLKPLFDNDADPRMEIEKKEIEEKSYRFINKWKDRSDYLENPAVLKEALDEYESWERDCSTDGDWGYYVWLRTQQDQNDPSLKAASGQVENFSRKIRNNIQFFTLRLAKIPSARQEKFLNDSRLSEYKHFLSRIFAEAKYMLSEAEEKGIEYEIVDFIFELGQAHLGVPGKRGAPGLIGRR